MKPLRVLFVSPYVIQGGAERYLFELLEGLGPEWIERVVLLKEGPLVDDLQRQGLPVEVLPTSRRLFGILRSALRLRRLLSRAHPDLVHADGIKGGLVAALATLGTRTPVVWVKHDFSWDGWLSRLVARRSEEIVAVSAAAAGTFGPKTRARTRIVHNGLPELRVDRPTGRRALLEALGSPEPRAVVGLVARLDPKKGHRELLAALPRLAERVPGVQVAFLGADDPAHADYPGELRREVAADGLGGLVSFLGFHGNAVELISGLDVLVIPSVRDRSGLGQEGFPYVALEAMAVGTPVIAYAHGGLPEMLGDCGLLVPPGDREALGEAVCRILGEPDLRGRLVDCGRERVAREFSLPRTVAAMQEIYVAAARPSR